MKRYVKPSLSCCKETIFPTISMLLMPTSTSAAMACFPIPTTVAAALSSKGAISALEALTGTPTRQMMKPSPFESRCYCLEPVS